MIDGITVLDLRVSIGNIFSHPELKPLWPQSVNKETGLIHENTCIVTTLQSGKVIEKPLVAKYNGQSFIIKNGKCKWHGSLQTYSNKGLGNKNDFTFQDVCNSVNDLAERFGIDIDNTKLNNVEFGLNLPYNTTAFLNSLVRYYQGTLIDKFKDLPGIEVEKTKNTNKIYQKGDNIMRVEIRANKMQYLTSKGVNITYLSDLKNPEIYPLLKEILLNSVNGLMVFDRSKAFTIDPQIIENYCSRDFWLRLKNDRTKRDYHLKRFKEIAETTGANWQQKELINLISQKWDYLSNYAKVPISENYAKVPVSENQLRESTFKMNCTIAESNNIDKIVCKVTGLDISMQPKNSKYLTPVGLSFYQWNKPEVYENLKKEYLSKKWQSEKNEIQLRELAHVIRAYSYNPRNNPRNNPKHAALRLIDRVENDNGGNKLYDDRQYYNPRKVELSQLNIENLLKKTKIDDYRNSNTTSSRNAERQRIS